MFLFFINLSVIPKRPLGREGSPKVVCRRSVKRVTISVAWYDTILCGGGVLPPHGLSESLTREGGAFRLNPLPTSPINGGGVWFAPSDRPENVP